MFKINDFRGGYCDNKLNLNMPDNTFPEFTNVDFIDNGGFKIRNGSKKINNEAYPDNVTQIIEWRLKSGVTKTVVVADKTMYVLSSVHGTYEPVKYNGENLVLKSDTVAYTFFKDYFYFTDGNKMYRWSDEVYYLHNLSVKNPYSFKKGDVIKLTVSKKESIFKGDEDTLLVDIRNNFPQKIRYLGTYLVSDNSYHYREFTNIKYKYVADDKICGLRAEGEVIKNGFLNCEIKDSSFVSSYASVKTEAPFYYNITENFINDSVPVPENEIIEFVFNDFGNRKDTEIKIKPSFFEIGTVDKYYIFNFNVDNFYPHNFNYNNSIQYFDEFVCTDENGNVVNGSLLSEFTDESVRYHIETIDVPADVLNCKFFTYHPMSFRFFASGNEYDPTAVYYSELQDFEKWQSKETEESTDLILNKFYPRYNFGPVKGLITADNYVVGCYKDGFTTISGDVPEEYIFRNLSVPFGVESTASITLIPNGIVFYSNGYIYYMSNSLLGSDYVKVPSQAELYSLSENKVDNVLNNSTGHKAVYFKNKYYLYFIDEKNEAHILVYNFSTASFLHYKNLDIQCFIVKDNLKLYGGSGKYVVSLFENGCHTDFVDGAEIQIKFKVKSKFYDLSNDFSIYVLRKLYLTTNCLDFTGIESNPDISISLRNDYIVSTTENAVEIPENPSRIHGSELWKNSIFNCVWCTNPDFNISLYDVSVPFSRIGFEISNSESSYFPLEFCVYDVSMDFVKGQNKNSHSYNNQKDDYILNYERR